MKIIILGAGEVGGALAEYLVADGNNEITVVDSQTQPLTQLQDRFDLRTVNGHASFPHVLHDAGAAEADMLIAVTNSDETNMVACQVAYSLFNTPNRIARIRAQAYVDENQEFTLFAPEVIPIDNIIMPEKLVTEYIQKLVEYPGTLQVASFADDKVFLVAVTAYYGGALIGDEIAEIKNHIPYIDTCIVALFRHGRAIRVQDSTIVEAGDEIFFVAEATHIKTILREFQRPEKPYKNIMIAGGGSIGTALAKALESNHNVKVVERNEKRANEVADLLRNTIVLHGEASEIELLAEEHIDQVDLFIAVTNDDEANIMSSMLAKKAGAQKTIVLIQRDAYIDLVHVSPIDITVSPKQTTISALLNHVRRGDIMRVFSLRRGIAEAIEIVAHGDANSSDVVGKTIKELKLPPSTVIGAIVRGDDVFIGNHDLPIADGDHIIMFLSDKKYIHDIERLFQPSASYL